MSLLLNRDIILAVDIRLPTLSNQVVYQLLKRILTSLPNTGSCLVPPELEKVSTTSSGYAMLCCASHQTVKKKACIHHRESGSAKCHDKRRSSAFSRAVSMSVLSSAHQTSDLVLNKKKKKL